MDPVPILCHLWPIFENQVHQKWWCSQRIPSAAWGTPSIVAAQELCRCSSERWRSCRICTGSRARNQGGRSLWGRSVWTSRGRIRRMGRRRKEVSLLFLKVLFFKLWNLSYSALSFRLRELDHCQIEITTFSGGQACQAVCYRRIYWQFGGRLKRRDEVQFQQILKASERLI